MTLGPKFPWTKSCNELPDENSSIIISVIFDQNITGDHFHQPNFVMISVTRVVAHEAAIGDTTAAIGL